MIYNQLHQDTFNNLEQSLISHKQFMYPEADLENFVGNGRDFSSATINEMNIFFFPLFASSECKIKAERFYKLCIPLWKMSFFMIKLKFSGKLKQRRPDFRLQKWAPEQSFSVYGLIFVGMVDNGVLITYKHFIRPQPQNLDHYGLIVTSISNRNISLIIRIFYSIWVQT